MTFNLLTRDHLYTNLDITILKKLLVDLHNPTVIDTSNVKDNHFTDYYCKTQVYLYKSSYDFKEIQGYNDIWYKQSSLIYEGYKYVIPPWILRDDPEYKKYEMVIDGEKKLKEIEIENEIKFNNRTYDKADNVGTIDSIDQFKKRFPKENIWDFYFMEESNQNLINEYGNYQKW